MTITVWPANAVTSSPQYNGQKLRHLIGAFWSGRSTTRRTGARTGVVAGTPADTVSATSTLWTVRPHAGVLDVMTLATWGAYNYSSDADVTGPVTAADLSNQRVDSIFVKLLDPEDGTTVPAVTYFYQAGTPGAAGGARGAAGGPPNVPAQSFELAQFQVPVSGGGSPVVTFVAPWVAAIGGILPCRNSTEYPDSITRYPGQTIYDLALKQKLTYDGVLGLWLPVSLGASTAFTPVLTSSGGGVSPGPSPFTAAFTQVGRARVDMDWALTVVSGFAIGTGYYKIGLPPGMVAATPPNTGIGTAQIYNGGVNKVAVAWLADSSHIVFNECASGILVGSAGPGAPWAIGDVFNGSCSFRLV